MTINEEIYAFVISVRRHVAEQAEILSQYEKNSRGSSKKYDQVIRNVELAAQAVEMMYEKRYAILDDKANFLIYTDDEIRGFMGKWKDLLGMDLYPDTNLTFLRSDIFVEGVSFAGSNPQTSFPSSGPASSYFGTSTSGVAGWIKFPTAIDDGEL